MQDNHNTVLAFKSPEQKLEVDHIYIGPLISVMHVD